jgi:hypothetical protein
MAVELRPDGQAPPTIFRQTNSGFEDVGSTIGFEPSHNTAFAVLSDLYGDSNKELFVKGEGSRQSVYDTTSLPFTDISATVLPNNNISSRDVAIADFNNDLLPDIYSTLSWNVYVSDLGQEGNNNAVASLGVNGDEQGIQFDTTGDVKFNLYIPKYIPPIPGLLSPSEVYIGAEGFNPTDEDPSTPDNLEFILSPTDPSVEGIFPHEPGTDRGVYIGYDSIRQRWQLLLSAPKPNVFDASIQATEPLSELTAIGFDPAQPPPEDQLLLNTGLKLIDWSEQSGINSVPNAGVSLVAGDFDNDMDKDIYVVATSAAVNRPNILYENQGDGTFIPVPDAGGAAGTSLGIGSRVTTADYDGDGFLDLFVTNQSRFVKNSRHELFHNLGNENHWLEIDLEGVVSNRDGIGAKVFVTADGVTQLHEQSGGIHNGAQNHQRIHFGLADNTKVDELVVRWPSGVEQRLENIPADQLIEIVEPSDSFSPGKPIYTVGSESGVFLWKDTFDGPYHLRTVGSGVATNFDVKLISTDALLEVTPFSLEPWQPDKLEMTDFGFSYASLVGSAEDGVDFRLAPGATALLSVVRDGIANPRQIYVGNGRNRLSPAGWIVNSDEFPVQPSFQTGQDLGLFVGRGTIPNVLEFRWNGDGKAHRTDISVIASARTASFSPVSIEPWQDEVTELDNGVNINGSIGPSWDGLNVTTTENVDIGFTYQQDGLTQPERVNPDDDLLGFPNAYRVPLATPYGQPEYDFSEDKGLYLWKDEQQLWHLRVTAGGELGTRYVGSITSDSSAVSVRGVEIESGDDIIDTSEPSRINFALSVSSGGQDGIDFSFPVGASLSLNLENPMQETTDLVQIGSEKWSIARLPLDLSGWQ